MGQSLTQLYIHLVFGTKFRQNLINSQVADSLHAYIGGILKNKECKPVIINSVPDHIHILFQLSKNFTLTSIVQDVKKDSSKWMKTQGISNFAWQSGYGAFSVSNTKLEVVKKYIRNQHEHHKKQSYKEEVEAFLTSNKMEYDKEYFWR